MAHDPHGFLKHARVDTPKRPAAERVRDFGKSSSMGRPAQPEELAPAYVFLAAPSCASYISSAVMPVMGGPTS